MNAESQEVMDILENNPSINWGDIDNVSVQGEGCTVEFVGTDEQRGLIIKVLESEGYDFADFWSDGMSDFIVFN